MKEIQPCTCLITGGAGFIGSHLAELLLTRRHKVLIIDDLSTGRWENIAHLAQNPRFQFAHASIHESVVLDRMASESQVIFHLAAAVGVRLIVENPVRTIETNISGTERVLNAAMRYRCQTVVTSTSEVYGKGLKVPFSEDDDVVIGPTSRSRWSYAASKMVDEFLALAYVMEYGADIICARLFNTVGPRQSSQYGMVIPRLIQQALRGEPLTVYGDGLQSRCFCDVDDVVRALLGLAAHAQADERVYNVGGTDEITILDLAKKILETTQSPSTIRFVPFDEVYSRGFEDMQRRVPDTTRIRNLLGWQPGHSLENTLKTVAQYERQRLAGFVERNGLIASNQCLCNVARRPTRAHNT